MATSTAGRELLAALAELPARRVVAARLLSLLDDDRTTAADLGRVIETDPALTVQVLRVANSPFYGLANQVASAARAVSVLGFTAVRALAVTTACDLTGATADNPPGFWPHSITTASVAAVVARSVGVDASQAFSIGLLHDLGVALLHRFDADAAATVATAAARDADRVALEEALLGTSHPEVAAAVLDACRLPEPFVRAVAHHHDPVGGDRQLAVLVAAEAVAEHMAGVADEVEAVHALDTVGCALIPSAVAAAAEESIASLAGFLTGT